MFTGLPNLSLMSSALRRGGAVAPVLLLSSLTVAEDATVGAVVGTLSVSNLPDGVTVTGYTITADPDSKFDISDDDLITEAALDYETATSHGVTIEAALSAGDPVSRAFEITVTNVFEQPDLGALTLDADEIESGAAEDTAVGAIVGKASGSTLSLVDDAGGRFKLSGTDIVAGATPTDYDTATSQNITVRETLEDSSNSPRDSVIPITVTEGGFDLTVLWAGSGKGAWYDPSDLSSMFKDTAGTTPVTADNDLVARINDKSGNGNHWLQGTSGARTKYRTDGTLHWLEYDGIDDEMAATSAALADDLTLIAGILTSDSMYYLVIPQSSNYAGLAQDGSGGLPHNGVYTPTYHASGSAISPTTRDALHTAWSTGAGVLAEVRNLDMAGFTGLSWGGYSSVSYAGRLFAYILAPESAMAANRSEVAAYMAEKSGVTL